MKIGDKVVCVNDSPCNWCRVPIGLKKGQVYVIDGIIRRNGGFSVLILGWTLSCAHLEAHNGEPKNEAWIERFRLLDEMKAEARTKVADAAAPDFGVLATLENEYVPNGIVPGEYGDYIDLKINADGIITNWPKNPDCSKFFPEDE